MSGCRQRKKLVSKFKNNDHTLKSVPMDENEKTGDIELKTIELIVTECDDPKPSSISAPNLESKKGSWLDLSQNQSIVSLRSGFLVFLYRRCSQKGAD